MLNDVYSRPQYVPEDLSFELDYSNGQDVLVHATSELFNEHAQLLSCAASSSIEEFSGDKETLLSCAKKLAASVLKRYTLRFATIDMNSPKSVYESVAQLESMLLQLQHYKNSVRLDYLEIDI